MAGKQRDAVGVLLDQHSRIKSLFSRVASERQGTQKRELAQLPDMDVTPYGTADVTWVREEIRDWRQQQTARERWQGDEHEPDE